MKKITNIKLFSEFLKNYSDGEYSVVEGEEFKDSKAKIKIYHNKCGNIILMSSHDFRVNHNCPLCSKKIRDEKKHQSRGVKKVKRTPAEYIELAIRNNPEYKIYNTDEVINGESIVSVQCPICSRTSNQKIKYLIIEDRPFSCRSCCRKISKEDFLIRFKEGHPTFYNVDLEDFDNGYISITCTCCKKNTKKDIHHALQSRNICHCENEKKFSKKVESMYNGQYEYCSGYKTVKSKVTLLHKECNRTFSIRASHFLFDNCTCTRCKSYKNEEKIKDYLEKHNIVFETQKTFDRVQI